jgi:hypothetical protein
MLLSARRQYVEQQKIAAAGLSQARRVATRGPLAVAGVIGRYQVASIRLSLEMAPLLLAEQGIDSAAAARVSTAALLTGGGAAGLLSQAETDKAFDRLVLSLIADAGRTAQSVDNATRPAVTGYVRSLSPPSCSRCAVLAGRVYRHSQGFLRHPRCDCLMTPTDDAAGLELVTQPRLEDIRGMSAADVQSVRDGADLGQVVNVRRSEAGLTVGSSVLARAGRPTPAGIYRMAADKAEALTLFRRFGYVL